MHPEINLIRSLLTSLETDIQRQGVERAKAFPNPQALFGSFGFGVGGHLRTQVVPNTDAVYEAALASGLFGCEAITKLRITHHDPITHLDWIALLPNLEDLYIRECPELQCLHGLTKLTHLRTLHIEICDGITALPAIPSLQDLSIFRCRRLRDVEGLAASRGIRKLRLQNCDNITTLRGLADLRAVDRLALRGLRGLEHLEGLDRLKDNPRFSIRACPHFERWPVIEPLPGFTRCSRAPQLILPDRSASDDPDDEA